MRRIGDENLRHAVELGGGLCGGAALMSGDEDMDVAADRLRRRERLGGRAVEGCVRVLGQEQNRHQITPASVLRR